MRIIVISVVAVLMLFICVVGYGVGDLFFYARRPLMADAKEKTIVLTSGQSLGAIANQLETEGFISHPAKFKWFARIKGYDKRIKAGEYDLSAAMSPETILLAIVSGKVHLYRVTIPEGFNLVQIAEMVERSELAASLQFIEAATDPQLLKKEDIKADSFEGYLFPDTYYFPREVTAEGIISTMTKRFHAIFSPDWQKRTKDLGFSVHEIVTLASMIEKETGVAIERPVISAVFHNRMKKGMRLESDPTVIYGIKGFKGNITRKHLMTPTPYNTYTRKGLPPGPIANPGKASIEAALFPADTAYVYFVSKGDGSHQFSTNITDHNRAVRKYQLKR